jgi:hypothetical protein
MFVDGHRLSDQYSIAVVVAADELIAVELLVETLSSLALQHHLSPIGLSQ